MSEIFGPEFDRSLRRFGCMVVLFWLLTSWITTLSVAVGTYYWAVRREHKKAEAAGVGRWVLKDSGRRVFQYGPNKKE